jgi:hypothetical protein
MLPALPNEDLANENIYKARADKYERWRDALYEAESKKSWPERIWQVVRGLF